jgi:allantoicase
MDFLDFLDLASKKVGGVVMVANDDFFAPKENLIIPAAPVWKEGKYTERGKWMDGWETRRRRSPRHDEKFDWCVIRLGLPGRVEGVVIDTAFFRGNYPSHCSIEGCSIDGHPEPDDLIGDKTEWKEILPFSALKGDTQNKFEVNPNERLTHLRLKIYPDGGVARLRAHGVVIPDWNALRKRDSEIDLAAAENGGSVPLASDMFFGHRQNLIMPGFAGNMSDGWESQRRRGPGHDWCVVKLGTPGKITRVEVDTSHFKGNYPESCSLEGGVADTADLDSIEWKPLLPMSKLQAHTRHSFSKELANVGEISHVRLNIFPDGGVSRLRIYGRIV